MSGRPEYLPDIVAGEWLDDGSRHVTLTRPHSGRVASLALPFYFRAWQSQATDKITCSW